MYVHRAYPKILQQMPVSARPKTQLWSSERFRFSQNTFFNFEGLDRVFNETGYLSKWKKGSAIPINGPVATESSWNYFSPSLKQEILPFLNKDAIPTLAKMLKRKKLGVLEEASDIWNESIALAAMEVGALDNLQLQRTVESVYRKSDPSNLAHCIQEVASKISNRFAEQFAQLSDLSTPEVKEILALHYIRLASLQQEGRFKNLKKDTLTQLLGEYQELMEKLPTAPLRNHLRDLRKYMKKGQKISPNLKLIQEGLIQILRESLGKKVSVQQMNQFLQVKHRLRRGLHLVRIKGEKIDYDRRKEMTKPFEALAEAQIANNCS